MKFNFKSRKGFTLIELLVVIGILAVLAAIAIPSVAGLIDRANVSADKTNSNEMTNAVERFTSEYELYCQDIASGALDEDNLDSAQGRVKNVVGVTTRAGIEGIEYAQGATIDDNVIAIYRDTKYPANAKTMQLVVQNYTKTSSSTFEPKQSDMHYWYSPDCGVVVFAESNADQNKEEKLNNQIISGMDAKGNKLDENTEWIDLTSGSTSSSPTETSYFQYGKKYRTEIEYDDQGGYTFYEFVLNGEDDVRLTFGFFSPQGDDWSSDVNDFTANVIEENDGLITGFVKIMNDADTFDLSPRFSVDTTHSDEIILQDYYSDSIYHMTLAE